MFALRKSIRSNRGQSLIELSFIIPVLVALGFGVIEASNIINSYLVLTHVTREASNLTSREQGVKGTPQWTAKVNTDLLTVIDNAVPVINRQGSGARGPNQFRIYYSIVEWRNEPGFGPCGTHKIGTSDDYYRIRRSNTGWTSNVTWQYGALNQTSHVGADGDCAYLALPEVKNLTAQGLKLHVVEVFFDYAPSKLTAAEAFIGAFVPGISYRRSVFMDVTGG
jgi:Flp pilus assembly protein TadG